MRQSVQANVKMQPVVKEAKQIMIKMMTPTT